MEILIISVVAFFAAILTFFSGFGLGTILTPVMMIFFPVEIAVAFTGIVHFSNNIFKLFIIGFNANKRVIIKFGIPAILAAFLGSYILVNLDTEHIIYSISLFGENRSITFVKFLVSILLIVFSIIDLVPSFKKLKFGQHILPLGGFLSGFFGGLTGNQGALRSAFLIKLKLEKHVFVGSTAVISFFVDFTRLGVYSTSMINIDYEQYYVLGLFAIFSAILGAFVGNKLLKKITLEFIQILVAILILILSLCFLLGIL
jgi:uncharacterized membrane protein YfcA